MRLRQSLQKQGISLHIGGLKLPVQEILERSGALVSGPDLQLSRTSAQALVAMRVSSATKKAL